MARLLMATVVALALSGMAETAQATIMKTFSYTGNNFTSASAPLSTSDSISGSFTVDCGLLGGAGDCSGLSQADYTAAVTSYSFTVGATTLSGAIGSNPLEVFAFTTNPLMDIVFWAISLGDATAFNLQTLNLPFVSQVFDIVVDGAFLGENSDSPGTWTVTTVAVPEPSGLSLLLTGLVAVLLFSLWQGGMTGAGAMSPARRGL